MKKIVRLTESDLIRLVKRVINEQSLGGLFSNPKEFKHDPSQTFILSLSKGSAKLDGIELTVGDAKTILPNKEFKLILKPATIVNYRQDVHVREVRCTSTIDCWITNKSIGDHLFDKSEPPYRSPYTTQR